MKRGSIIALGLTSLLFSGAANAGVAGFTIVNGTGRDLVSLSIRRVGTDPWQPLATPPAAGKTTVAGFRSEDCAFDLKATAAGGAILIWPSVNLCDVKLLTLRRNDAGLAWVDYD